MTDTIRLLIADDHSVVRYGLGALMETVPDIEIVGAAADGVEVVELAQALRPDVILLDLLMPRQDGVEAISEIRASNPEAHILILTSFIDDEKIFAAIRAGARGYVLKDSPPQQLMQGIRAVDRGEMFMPPAMARKLEDEVGHPVATIVGAASAGGHPPVDPVTPPPKSPLTGQEMNVVQFLAQGLTNQEIAEKLMISERTVGLYVGNILKKLHVANRTQAALHALREGWATLR
jgi:NarL family two-component system response regulator LiaR